VFNYSHDEFVCSHTPQQVLHSHIVAAVNEFPAGATRNRYAQAALSWRHPYWDWAAQPSDGQSVLPASISSPTVNVIMPNGSTTIANPLYAYRFHPVSMEDFYYQPVSSKKLQEIVF
jgi:tyrosinase